MLHSGSLVESGTVSGLIDQRWALRDAAGAGVGGFDNPPPSGCEVWTRIQTPMRVEL